MLTRRDLGVMTAAGLLPMRQALGQAEAPRRGGTAIAAADIEPRSLDPLYGDGGPRDDFAILQLYETLVTVDAANALHPQLAESWTLAADRRSMELKLRGGVRFHDGSAFDAAAVVFNVGRAIAPTLVSQKKADFESLAGAEALAPDLVRVRFRSASSGAPMALTLLKMVSPTAVAAGADAFHRRPVGTGPFRFAQWQAGSAITMDRNPDYWRQGADGQKLPYLDRVVLRIIPDPTVRFLELQSGNVHVIDNLLTREVPAVQRRGDSTLLTTRFGDMHLLVMNAANPRLADIRVRRAILHALNPAVIGRAATQGQAVPVTSFAAPGAWYHDATVSTYRPDPARARALLAEAGAGNLTLSIEITQREPTTLIAQLMQAQLRAVGVTTNIRMFDRQAFVEVMRGGHNLALTRYSGPDIDPASLGRIFGREAAFQRTGVPDPVLFALMDRAREAADQAERARLYREAQERLYDQASYGFLFFVPAHQAYRNVLANMRRSITDAWLFDEIWLRA